MLSLTTTYGVVILIAAGVSDPFRWQILTAVLALVGLIVGGILNDKIGRRPLAIGGLILVAILDFAAGGVSFTGLVTSQQGLAMAGISIVIAFACQVAFSGQVTSSPNVLRLKLTQNSIYTLMSEIPAATLREHTISYTIFCSLGATIVSTVALPYILGAP
jgi:MFS family permease